MRQTSVHKKIISFLTRTAAPVSVEDLLKVIPANKTTVYRQLDSLKTAGLLTEVHLADRKTRFELSSLKHHHHLTCNRCRSITDIIFPRQLEQIFSAASGQKKFLMTSHSLELFGLCHNCRS